MRYAYGGDLQGNVWRFDLTRTGAGEIDAELLATLRDADGNAQPVTAAPELTRLLGRRVVLVGTGRLLDIGDFGSTRTMSFYAIADGTALGNARSGLVRQTYTRATDTLTTNTVNWATDRGWYFDLPAGEQASTDPDRRLWRGGFRHQPQRQPELHAVVDDVPASTSAPASKVARARPSSRSRRCDQRHLVARDHAARRQRPHHRHHAPVGQHRLPARTAAGAEHQRRRRTPWRELRR